MKKMLPLIAAVVTLVSCPDVQAESPSLYDVQFEANGMTYTLYDQSFPLELSVDDSGYGSFRDVFDNLYTVAALDRFTQSSEWLSQSGDEASLKVLSSTDLADWSQADELSFTDFGPNGELVFEHDTNDPVRFYRFKVEE